MATLRKFSAMESQLKKKVHFCRKNLTENILENLMQEIRSSIFKNVIKPCSLSSSQMKDEVCAKGVEWWPQLLFPNHQSLESQREQQIALTKILNIVRRNANCSTFFQLNKNDIIMGPLGSGKLFLCRVALCYARKNVVHLWSPAVTLAALTNWQASRCTDCSAFPANNWRPEELPMMFF